MRKKYILFAALISIAFGIKAQSFEFIYDGNVIQDTLHLNISTGDERTDYVHFKNITSETKNVKVYLQKLELANEGMLFMCFDGECLLDTISADSILLEPNVEYLQFDLLYMYATDHQTIARIHLVDPTTLQSIQSFVVQYKNFNISLGKPINSNVTSLEAYPNPAKNSATINYSIPSNYRTGNLVVRNMIGSVVKTISINGGSTGKQSISTYDLPNGVYFYSIVGDGTTLSTKKLVVKH